METNDKKPKESQEKRTIYFITGNKSKFEEAQLIMQQELGETDIEFGFADIKLEEPKTLDQERIVRAKAEQAFKALGKPVICDDTAIVFEAYNNFPGTFTKYVFETIGFEGVAKLLAGKSRNAHFQTLLCYKDDSHCLVFRGTWRGVITEDISKMFNPDWQYNSIFIPEGFLVPLSELTMEERAKHSHRKKALQKLAEWLSYSNEKSNAVQEAQQAVALAIGGN
jgi:non-canonical purine NTP pyrophosphatase (RdgB/HAM1 family)